MTSTRLSVQDDLEALLAAVKGLALSRKAPSPTALLEVDRLMCEMQARQAGEAEQHQAAFIKLKKVSCRWCQWPGGGGRGGECMGVQAEVHRMVAYGGPLISELLLCPCQDLTVSAACLVTETMHYSASAGAACYHNRFNCFALPAFWLQDSILQRAPTEPTCCALPAGPGQGQQQHQGAGGGCQAAAEQLARLCLAPVSSA
jgi:hypothetical protein